MSELADGLVALVLETYLKSSDFNGLAVNLADMRSKGSLDLLVDLVGTGQLDVNFGDVHPNPHIKALDLGSSDAQLTKIKSEEFERVVLYPTTEILTEVVDTADYASTPFACRLALGEPQLQHYAFDLAVLEQYRNDPRYLYRCDDISGYISVSDSFYQKEGMSDSDQTLLENFGFCFSEKQERAVAVYLRYLKQLTPEHQQIWNARILAGNYVVHPDYSAKTMGYFPNGISGLTAILGEMDAIYRLSEAVRGVPIFLRNFGAEKRPNNFSFLIRPTLREFNEFIMVLDKVLSENLNRKYFSIDMETTEDIQHSNGRTEVRQIGTIRLLRSYLDRELRYDDPELLDLVCEPFSSVRRMRQKPAHSINQDEFDQEYIRQQRDLIGQVWQSLNCLRQLFQTHPNAHGVEVQSYLDTAEVRSF